MHLTQIKQAAAALSAVLLIYGCTPSADDAVTPVTVPDVSTETGTGGAGSTAVSVTQLIAEAGSTVYFGFDRYDLDADARATLGAQAGVLQSNPSATVTVQGHCDERGTREYNLALGERRANSVKNYLVALGVAASRVDVISYGKERPAVTGNTEAAWSKNRRGATVIN